MPFWSKGSKAAGVESAEQTLARLQAESATSNYPESVTRALGDHQLRLRRSGYIASEVDAFLATIDGRTSDEINGVRFNTTAHLHSYNEDDVDNLLDSIVAHRARDTSTDSIVAGDD